MVMLVVLVVLMVLVVLSWLAGYWVSGAVREERLEKWSLMELSQQALQSLFISTSAQTESPEILQSPLTAGCRLSRWPGLSWAGCSEFYNQFVWSWPKLHTVDVSWWVGQKRGFQYQGSEGGSSIWWGPSQDHTQRMTNLKQKSSWTGARLEKVLVGQIVETLW